ncbi:MAG: N-acetyltransferase [Chromatiaceae bacterium]|nr:MAG: N-acetyltransferase [Chromatiaceae bacterium]
MPQLRTDRFHLRPFAPADVVAFSQAVRESSATVGRWMNWAHAGYSEREARAWFRACRTARAEGSAYEFGIFSVADGLLVGGAGLNQFNRPNGFCNLGYWVRASQQRRGAALAAVQALAPYAFSELQLIRVEIVVAVGNTPSFRLALKAGATYEGCARNRLRLHGRLIAAYVFSLVPGDLATPGARG